MSAAPLREARIHLDALKQNLDVFRRMVAPAAVMAVVKADAYGHGLIPVARAAIEGGADWLGVADLDEAFALRSAGISAPGARLAARRRRRLRRGQRGRIELGLSSIEQLERAVETGRRDRAPQARHGPQPQRDRARRRRAHLPARGGARAARSGAGPRHLQPPLEHLRATTTPQLEAFERARGWPAHRGLEPELRHIASSQAAIERPSALRSGALGVGLYGLPPADVDRRRALGLRP
jgi:alanine racemase